MEPTTNIFLPFIFLPSDFCFLNDEEFHMRLQNKVALITGGGNGIGRATALAFAREGAKVVVADLNLEAANKVVEEISLQGGEGRSEHVNVAAPEQVERMVQNTLAAWGRLDILVNNAGILADARLVKMPLEQWQRVIDVNLKGVFLCAQAAARAMEAQNTGGVILNAASVVGLYGNFGQSNYVAAKAGVIGMTKTWARELGKKGIRVNAVAPGFIATEMVQAMPEKVIAMMKEKTPLARMGAPEDIANAYLFLASEEASFITGIVLSVDGGVVV
jgi:3-oxoacyl-[acyl-carrier protein] reductase